jgi:hypothetical protein
MTQPSGKTLSAPFPFLPAAFHSLRKIHDLQERLPKRYRFANMPRIQCNQREHVGRTTKCPCDRLLLEANRRAQVSSRRALTEIVAQTRIETCACGVRPLGLRTVPSSIGRTYGFAPASTCTSDNLMFAAGLKH